MFRGRYYMNKFVFIDADGVNTLYEISERTDGREYVRFVPDEEKSGEVAMYLVRDPKKTFDGGVKVPLGLFLEQKGYSNDDFKNPFGRTKRIVEEIRKINGIEKPKVKGKKNK